MSFKIYNCDFGVKVDGVGYDFEHVNEVSIESSVRNRVTRGANAKNKVGIVYKDGLKEPDRWTVPILEMSVALKAVLDDCYTNQKRLEAYCIDRTNGSSKMLKNAVLSNQPQQLVINDSADSLAVSLEFESFDSSEILKE